MLLGGHFESPVLRVSWFWQVMLSGRFGLMGVQVLISNLNLLSPQVSLQYGVFFQGPKMKGAGKKVLISAIKVQYTLVHCWPASQSSSSTSFKMSSLVSKSFLQSPSESSLAFSLVF